MSSTNSSDADEIRSLERAVFAPDEDPFHRDFHLRGESSNIFFHNRQMEKRRGASKIHENGDALDGQLLKSFRFSDESYLHIINEGESRSRLVYGKKGRAQKNVALFGGYNYEEHYGIWYDLDGVSVDDRYVYLRPALSRFPTILTNGENINHADWGSPSDFTQTSYTSLGIPGTTYVTERTLQNSLTYDQEITFSSLSVTNDGEWFINLHLEFVLPDLWTTEGAPGSQVGSFSASLEDSVDSSAAGFTVDPSTLTGTPLGNSGEDRISDFRISDVERFYHGVLKFSYRVKLGATSVRVRINPAINIGDRNVIRRVSLTLARFPRYSPYRFLTSTLVNNSVRQVYPGFVFDRFSESLRPWGVEPPDNAPVLTSSAGWAASTNPITVSIGLKYAFAVESSWGHISSLGPPSSPTGAYADKQATMSFTAPSDTTNYPYILVFATGDGGGRFYQLERIANTGGAINYSDNVQRLNPTTIIVNPGDGYVDRAANDPPLSNDRGDEDYGNQSGGGMVYFNERIFYACGRRVYFSVLDEWSGWGKQEECFPAGAVSGNRFVFDSQVKRIVAGKDLIYTFTGPDLHSISGRLKRELSSNGLHQGLSLLGKHTAATLGNQLFFMDEDRRLWRYDPQMVVPQLLSAPIQKVLNSVNINLVPKIEIFQYRGWALLAVLLETRKLYIYDILRQSWHSPWFSQRDWRGISNASGKLVSFRGLTVDGNNLNPALAFPFILETDESTLSDHTTNYGAIIETSFRRTPAGNHVNLTRRPIGTYTLESVEVQYEASAEATVEYDLDDQGSFTALSQKSPLHLVTRNPSRTRSDRYRINELGRDVRYKITSSIQGTDMILHSLITEWISQGGE